MGHSKVCFLYHLLHWSPKKIRKWIKILTLIFSINGVLSWKFFQNTQIAQLSSIIVAITSTIQLIENFLYHSDDEIDYLNQMSKEFSTFNSKLEKLWFKLNSNSLSIEKATDAFFKLKDIHDKEVAEFDKKVRIKIFKRIENRAEKSSKILLTRYFTK